MVAFGRVAGTVVGAVAVVTLALGLGGCSSASAPPDATQSAGGTESQTTTPSESTPAPDDAQWAISPTGIGPFEIGMRYADALTVPGADVSETCDGVAQVANPDGTDITMWVTASERDPASTLSEISISAPAETIEDVPLGPVTDEGIGLGSTVSELTDAYPDARELDDTAVPDRSMYFVQVERGGIIFTTSADADVVWQISVTTGEVPAYEPCA